MRTPYDSRHACVMQKKLGPKISPLMWPVIEPVASGVSTAYGIRRDPSGHGWESLQKGESAGNLPFN